MKARDVVVRVSLSLIGVTIFALGTAQNHLNTFGRFLAAAAFALVGWYSFFHARRLCAERALIAKRFYPRLLQRIWQPSSFRTVGQQLIFRFAGIVFFLIGVAVFIFAVHCLFVSQS
jgi:hypothetical protein